jgi:hypothetical protein
LVLQAKRLADRGRLVVAAVLGAQKALDGGKIFIVPVVV